MTVPDCETDCGKRSAGKTPNKDLTFLRVHNICFMSIKSLSKPCVHNLSERNNQIRDKNIHVMGSGNGLLNFNSTLILPLSGYDVCPSEALRSGVKSKSNMK